MAVCSGPIVRQTSRIPESASALSTKSRNGLPIGIIAFIPESAAFAWPSGRVTEGSGARILFPSPRARITALVISGFTPIQSLTIEFAGQSSLAALRARHYPTAVSLHLHVFLSG